ncbi:hypothetical protein FO519_007650 [Halicephalobus sp. NKZ332]|nr:hypothetical protein FO519_007650 [Halicephalobus sp. NKZ332]
MKRVLQKLELKEEYAEKSPLSSEPYKPYDLKENDEDLDIKCFHEADIFIPIFNINENSEFKSISYLLTGDMKHDFRIKELVTNMLKEKASEQISESEKSALYIQSLTELLKVNIIVYEDNREKSVNPDLTGKLTPYISNYSVRKIIQFQMFACGDVEYPIEESIDFVNSIVIPHVNSIVQRCTKNMEKRQSKKPELVDLLIQYKNNAKLLKRMHDYIHVMKNIKYNSTFNAEGSNEKDSEEEEEESNEDNSNPLADKFLAAISEIDSDEKLIKFISDTSLPDSVKLSRNKKIAERTKSMTVEKYKRFAEARSCSFIRFRGKIMEEYINGFTAAIRAPESFDRDLLNLLNFCAIEMLNVLVENADKIRRKELGSFGNSKSKMKFGAIQLEHYQAAANPVLKRKSEAPGSSSKKVKLQDPTST